MDVRIEAAPMAAKVEAVAPEVTTVTATAIFKVMPEAVASFSCPSVSGHSISAVTPDSYIRMEELAA